MPSPSADVSDADSSICCCCCCCCCRCSGGVTGRPTRSLLRLWRGGELGDDESDDEDGGGRSVRRGDGSGAVAGGLLSSPSSLACLRLMGGRIHPRATPAKERWKSPHRRCHRRIPRSSTPPHHDARSRRCSRGCVPKAQPSQDGTHNPSVVRIPIPSPPRRWRRRMTTG